MHIELTTEEAGSIVNLLFIAAKAKDTDLNNMKNAIYFITRLEEAAKAGKNGD